MIHTVSLPDLNALQQQAQLHLQQRRPLEAIACYRTILQHQWHTPMAMYTLNLLTQHGQLDAAHTLLQQAVQYEPHNPAIHFSVTFRKLLAQPVSAWQPHLHAVAQYPHDPLQQYAFMQYRLLWLWLTGQPHDDIHTMCDAIDIALRPWRDDIKARRPPANVKTAVANNMTELASYAAMLRTLATLQHGPRTIKPELPPLLLLGDSHVIPPHFQRVLWAGQTYQIHSDSVVGLKAWHMANLQRFPYGQYLASKLATLPPNLPVLFSCGEIDCRWNQGIWPQVQRGRLVSDVLTSTFVPAAQQLAKLAGKRPWGVLGIPAPHIQEVVRLPAAEREPFGAMVAAANQTLKAAVTTAGGTYVDMYALTADEVGIRKPDLDLDNTHLHPAALAQALQNTNQN